MNLIAFDVETWGNGDLFALQPWRAKTGDAWLTAAAWHADDLSKFDPADVDHTKAPDVEAIRRVLQVCAAEDIRIVCWNAVFDVAWLVALGLGDEVKQCTWLDGMLLYQHCYRKPKILEGANRRRYGLKAAVAEFFPKYATYAEDVTFNPQTPSEWVKLRKYNKADCVFTLKLAQKFLRSNRMDQAKLNVILIEAETIPLAAEAWVNGIDIDIDAAKALAHQLKIQEVSNLTQLQFKYPDVTPAMLASPKQLEEFLFDELELPTIKRTPAGARSTDRESLLALAQMDPVAARVADYREAMNNAAKFSHAPVQSVSYNKDGKTHPQFNIYGTYTGRGTYSSKTGPKGKSEVPTGIAIHQWKRDPAYRRIISVPEGYKLCELDFSGQEFRWMAVESNDPTMLSLCKPSEDAHAYMGSKAGNVDYRQLMVDVRSGDAKAKALRQMGKVTNLSLQYRTSARRLKSMAFVQHGMRLTDLECKTLHKLYRDTYREVPNYWKRKIEFVRQHKYMRNLAGRMVYLDHPHNTDVAARVSASADLSVNGWTVQSTAVNFPIQSMGADQKYLALKVAKEYLTKYNGYFLMELHDGLFFVFPEDVAEKALQELGKALSNLPYKEAFNLILPIDFPVDAKIGNNWGDLKEVDIL